LFGYAATFVLGAIGVRGEPPDPATPFEELTGPDHDPSFLSASVQPLTLRSTVEMLLVNLPPADRAFVGAILLNSGTADYDRESNADRRSIEVDELRRTPSAALDQVPVAPLFYFHLGASQRSLVRDAQDQIRRWKAKRGLGSSKVQTAKLTEHLRVWDLREGWVDGRYDAARELAFDAVARRLRQPLSTITNRYRAAFEAVVGQPFKPALWWQVFGPLKFGSLLGDAKTLDTASHRHRLTSPVRRPVPDSVVSGVNAEGESNSIVEGAAITNPDFDFNDMRMTLDDLIVRGLSDDDIARRCHEGCDPKLIAQYRSMSAELKKAAQP